MIFRPIAIAGSVVLGGAIAPACSTPPGEAITLVHKACSDVNLSGTNWTKKAARTEKVGSEVLDWRVDSKRVAQAARLDPRWTQLVTSFQQEEQSWRIVADAIGMKAPADRKQWTEQQHSDVDSQYPSDEGDIVDAAWQNIQTMCAIAKS